MKPSELTVEVVREELEHLINKYPERTGSILVRDEVYDDYDMTCVYYVDEDGLPVSVVRVYAQDEEAFNSIALKTPVCIVGQWVESFHPEFKQDEVIRNVLIGNATMRYAITPFSPEVQELLKRAQDQQDWHNTPWGAIDLDKVDPW